MDNNKVWFITGASKGLGLTLAKTLLDNGYRVAATSRSIDDLTGQLGGASDTLSILRRCCITFLSFWIQQ